MDNTQIKYMVDRFLQWRLPDNFNPDAGICFKAEFNENTPYASRHKPVGTNLFDAGQAEAMVRFMVEGLAVGWIKRNDEKCFECGHELQAPICPACNPDLAMVQPDWGARRPPSAPEPLNMLVDADWLREKIAADPDMDCEVRPAPAVQEQRRDSESDDILVRVINDLTARFEYIVDKAAKGVPPDSPKLQADRTLIARAKAACSR